MLGTLGDAEGPALLGGLFSFDLAEQFEPLPAPAEPARHCPDYLFLVPELLLTSITWRAGLRCRRSSTIRPGTTGWPPACASVPTNSMAPWRRLPSRRWQAYGPATTRSTWTMRALPAR